MEHFVPLASLAPATHVTSTSPTLCEVNLMTCFVWSLFFLLCQLLRCKKTEFDILVIECCIKWFAPPCSSLIILNFQIISQIISFSRTIILQKICTGWFQNFFHFSCRYLLLITPTIDYNQVLLRSYSNLPKFYCQIQTLLKFVWILIWNVTTRFSFDLCFNSYSKFKLKP